MVKSEAVQIDSVQSALGGGAGGLEEGIDVSDVATGVDDDGSNDRPGDDIGIVEEDEVEM